MMRTDKEIEEYFNKFIFGFIFNDIESCIKARTNYTTALGLLSYTEFLGGLINGTLGLQGRSREQFNKALEFFEWNGNKNYYKNFKVTLRDVDFVQKEADIYSLFRCGLAHEYFIKGDSLVHNNPEGYTDGHGRHFSEGCIDADAGVQIIREGKIKRIRFHNNAYFRDFKKAWQKYYDKLIKSKSSGLRNTFNNSLDRLVVREIKI